MDVARYATPYLARRDFALAPSLDLRDWKRPASRPNFSVVSSADSGVVGSVFFSSSFLNMWRADVDGGCVNGVCSGSAAFQERLVKVVDGWKDREPSRTASATMRDFANKKTRERSIIDMEGNGDYLLACGGSRSLRC